MPYRFIDRADAGDALLLTHVETVPWGLYETADDGAGDPVAGDLAALIESAKRYPPALGLARDEVPAVFLETPPTREQLAAAYATALRTHLARQHEAPYVVAAATRDIPGDLVRGQWYWLLDVNGSPPVVSWVSPGYTIFQSDLATFDLTGDQLKRLGFAG